MLPFKAHIVSAARVWELLCRLETKLLCASYNIFFDFAIYLPQWTHRYVIVPRAAEAHNFTMGTP